LVLLSRQLTCNRLLSSAVFRRSLGAVGGVLAGGSVTLVGAIHIALPLLRYR
jgi:hypothetical protein